MVRTPFGPTRNLSCAIRFCIEDYKATAFIFDHDQESVDEFLARLRAKEQALQQDPIVFMNILVELYGYASENYRTLLDKQVVSVELQTRMTSLNPPFSNANPTDDSEEPSRDIHRCNTSPTMLEGVLEFEAQPGDFRKQTHQDFPRMRHEKGHGEPPVQKRDFFVQSLDYHINASCLRRNQTRSLQKRTQSQMSVVSLSQEAIRDQ